MLYSETHLQRFNDETVIAKIALEEHAAVDSALKSTGYLLSVVQRTSRKITSFRSVGIRPKKGEDISFIRMNRSLSINSYYELYTI